MLKKGSQRKHLLLAEAVEISVEQRISRRRASEGRLGVQSWLIISLVAFLRSG